MSEEEKIFAGVLFAPSDPELKAMKLKAHKLNLDYNRLYEDETASRDAVLQELLGKIGENTFFQGPITFHYGSHTRVGSACFFNFNLTVQDDALVTIGDRCNFGPNVTIVTPCHPMLSEERNSMLDKDGIERHFCWAKPVNIEDDCWLGANVLVCPGVTIGAGCVIGAGSVVTKNIPARSFAAGNPCRVIRELSEQDSMKYRPDILSDNRIIEHIAE